MNKSTQIDAKVLRFIIYRIYKFSAELPLFQKKTGLYLHESFPKGMQQRRGSYFLGFDLEYLQ